MKKILFCLLSGALCAFSSCQSDELTIAGTSTEGNTVTSTDKAVKFTYNNTLPSVRTYYHIDENGVSARWSDNDMVAILSPAPPLERDLPQIGSYAIEGSGGNASGNFVYYDYFDDEYDPDGLVAPIRWNAYDTEQDFYAYYPVAAVTESSETLGGIISVDFLTGSANFIVPSDQSAMAHIVPSASKGAAHPLAYAVAATKNVPINSESSVQLVFHDFMNVLRIHVNNPTGKIVKGVKVNTTSNDIYVAGITRATFPSESQSYDTHAQSSDFIIGHEDLYDDGYNPYIPLSNEIRATTTTPSDSADLYYDLYLLPQYYPTGSLQVTVMIGNDNEDANDIAKVIQSEFSKSNLKQVVINIAESASFGIDMVSVPGGTFELGGRTDSYFEVSTHPTVKLSGFRMSKTEITQGQWVEVITAGIHALQNNTGAAAALGNAGFSMSNNNLQLNNSNTGITTTDAWPGNNPSSSTGMSPNHPAYNVSYNDVANIFIPMLNILTGRNYKLPTEAQWEYAARGGSVSNDYAGATGGLLAIKLVGWFGGSNYDTAPASPADGERRTQAVGQLTKNGYGLYDMTGNVSEWCCDYSYPNYPDPAPDDYVYDTYTYYRVCRGGGYDTFDYSALYVSYRDRDEPTARKPSLGFRLVIND